MTSLAACRYAVVSPVKDEEKYVERTIRSVLGQTIRPVRWIIVDDGSKDRTPEIIKQGVSGIDWIQCLRIDRDGNRELGITEIKAFTVGHKLLEDVEYDFIVKLDCDVELPPTYFEEMLRRFDEKAGLGIASGAFFEEHDGQWVFIRMPDYHASGATKMVRAKCFRDIGGFVQRKGWDTIDEIRARALGWETERIQTLTFRHLKREGSASGVVYSNLLEAEVDYVIGNSLAFVLLKAIYRMVSQRPFVVAGSIMLWGFVKAWITSVPRQVTKEQAIAYRSMLRRRVRRRIVELFGFGGHRLEEI